MTTSLPERAVRRCHNVINPLHATIYFSPDLQQEMTALGVDNPRAAYFASRSAAMGAVGAGVVAAAFYNFSPGLVARHVPAVWETASPEAVLAARLRAVDTTLRRVLGEEALAAGETAEAARLALRATEACAPHARPLYAAHADLPVPEEPHLALWHAATLLREHRGDGHLAVLLRAELDPLEALVTHSATGKGMSRKWILATRGWSEEELDAARGRLCERGLLGPDGELTEAGTALRRELEEETDRLDRAPYEHLGAEGVGRLMELAGALLTRAQEAGAFPRDLISR
ncbi:hypothetical protein ACIHAA_03760 [Streptomyces sp. NPDC052040]|uniref:SCO6745 family protein n=1 Tax=Streptomyces sp. NPDC052040 TaxID=3365682 RepID=UPI0037D54D77